MKPTHNLPDGEWLVSGGLIYRLRDGVNCDEINVAMVDGSRDTGARTTKAGVILALLEAPVQPAALVAVGEQEPAAWMTEDGRVAMASLKAHGMANASKAAFCIPLYRAAPRLSLPVEARELTDADVLADPTLKYHFGLNGGNGPVSTKGWKIINAVRAVLAGRTT